ncbi:50S ribosomal protein L23 [Patescibacteria group bacterium]|nr:50S ribosomal protein L23 [Patescibacteria group bacterium]MBU4023516.1 50S ribosomal protein L23 [Patescibacteria group bacterium]MBU4078024.1 50S ribosomal protein L23 [Patescibacteria group bacterium]
MSLFDIFKKKSVQTDKPIEAGKIKELETEKKAVKVEVEKKIKPIPEPKTKTIEKAKIIEKAKPKPKPKIAEKKEIKIKTKEKEQDKEKKPETKTKPKKALKGTDAWESLFSPHVTEKATDLAGENKYVFKVFKRANKIDIKKAVGSLYGVEVEDIKIINVRKKARKVGKTQGFRKGYKKAIVKIKKGQEIEILPH